MLGWNKGRKNYEPTNPLLHAYIVLLAKEIARGKIGLHLWKESITLGFLVATEAGVKFR